MISVSLAKSLRRAGLEWRPTRFDFFHIPDRDLDERVFVIADLSVDVQPLADGINAITFNSAVEWSLDYILQQDVVWLPTEGQLRALLSDHLLSLEKVDGGFTCHIRNSGRAERHTASTAPDAYGLAVGALLRTGVDLNPG